MTELIGQFLNAQLDVGFGKPILWREIVGNLFGLASAVWGMQRRVVAWPIGIIGNILLFTVFLGGVFATPQDLDLWGQAGRQIFFLATSTYGWVRWARYRREAGDSFGVAPRWARTRERVELIIGAAVGMVVFTIVLHLLGSWGPVADAWILTGSILATYGMARGWTEFWLIWIAVDLVGVPLLWMAGYYPSALMYVVYGLFCSLGFWAWRRTSIPEPRPAG